MDLDGDGRRELLCNVQWMADGAVDTLIYHSDGTDVYQCAGTDVMMAVEGEVPVYGPGSVGAKYLPESNRILGWYWDEKAEDFVEKEYEIVLEALTMWEFQ